MAFGDFNGDGKLDIVGACCTTEVPPGILVPSPVVVLLGVGDGSFSDATELPNVYTLDVAVGRINGDTSPDVLLGDIVHSTLVTMLSDPLARVQFTSAPATVTENAGTVTLTLTRSGSDVGDIAAVVSVSGGTAIEGTDVAYPAPRTVTWGNGATGSRTVQVPILQDQIADGTKTIQFTVSKPGGPTWWAPGVQTTTSVTITDDDLPPAVNVANVSVVEGAAGTKLAQFPVTLSGVATTQTITVAYATTDGSATAGSDYTTTSGTLTFPPGTTSRTIDVPIVGDSSVEPDETFTVTLSSPTTAILGNAQGIGIIQNDDTACSPRPRVTQAPAAGGGALAVHIESTPLNTAASNPLQHVRFGAFQNATVTLNGQAVTAGQSITLPAGTSTADLVVRRITSGTSTTVPFTVVDGCGEWKTFVGGGTDAGF
jgi:hypothetical protein